MLRLGSVVLGVGDVERAVAFWSQVLGYDPVAFPDASNGFTILRPPSGEGVRVALQRSDTPAQAHPRIHLDLVVDTAAEQATGSSASVPPLSTGRSTRRTPTSWSSPTPTATGSA